MEIKIEKGIPIPVSTKPTRLNRYPLKEMEVGDSIYDPKLKPNSFYLLAMNWKKMNGFSFKFKALKEGTGSRLWRVG